MVLDLYLKRLAPELNFSSLSLISDPSWTQRVQLVAQDRQFVDQAFFYTADFHFVCL